MYNIKDLCITIYEHFITITSFIVMMAAVYRNLSKSLLIITLMSHLFTIINIYTYAMLLNIHIKLYSYIHTRTIIYNLITLYCTDR